MTFQNIIKNFFEVLMEGSANLYPSYGLICYIVLFREIVMRVNIIPWNYLLFLPGLPQPGITLPSGNLVSITRDGCKSYFKVCF